MASSKSVVQYLAKCYEAEKFHKVGANLFKIAAKERVDISDTDVLSGKMPILPLESKYSESILKKLSISESDKLKMGVLFTYDVKTHFGKDYEVLEPLIEIDARIFQQDDHYYYELDFETIQINFYSNSAFEKRVSEEVELKAINLLEEEKISFESISSLIKLLGPYLHEEQVEWKVFPLMKNYRSIRKSFQPSKQFLPVAQLYLTDNDSQNGTDLINEVRKIEEKGLSKPLEVLYGNEVGFARKGGVNVSHIPFNLSETQLKAVDTSLSNTLSVVIGPPGTGKSTTIAAMAVEHFYQKKCVLIVSNNYEALNVVKRKIENEYKLLSLATVGANKGAMKKQLARYIKDIMTGNYSKYKNVSYSRINRSFEEDIFKEQKEIDSFKRLLNRLTQLRQESNEVNSKFKRKLIKRYQKIIKYINNELDERLLTDIVLFEEALNRLNKAKSSLLQNLLLKRRTDALWNGRETLNNFKKLLLSIHKSSAQSYKHNIDYKQLFQFLSIWLFNPLRIGDLFPDKEAFDLVIIDEASQVNMAQALPAIQKAKRVVVCGDNKQLNHFSFLSKTRQSIFANECGLDSEQKELFNYRDKSVLDLAIERIQNSGQITFLDQHYRSVPEIIDFSNRHFYNGQLIVVKDQLNKRGKAIEWEKCSGTYHKGVNEAEAELVVKHLLAYVQQGKSIGIVSPFSKQVELIEKKLFEKFTWGELKSMNVSLGTIYKFQGNEKDIVIISWAVDKNASGNQFSYLNNPNAFNVLITRARNRIVNCYSFEELTNLPNSASLLRAYFKETQKTFEFKKNREESPSLEILKHLNLSVKPEYNYNFHGFNIDAFIEHGEKKIAIDFIVGEGEVFEHMPFSLYQYLFNKGVTILPVTHELIETKPSWVKQQIETALS